MTPVEKVEIGVARFLDLFRTISGTDAEPELAEPPMCVECQMIPAAYLDRCFGCNAKGALPA